MRHRQRRTENEDPDEAQSEPKDLRSVGEWHGISHETMAEALTSPRRAVQFIRLMRCHANAMDAPVPMRQ
jgi:hypothetical protein